ncbi:hypothetical protein BDP55DRAFT_137682 [Colletotrichum godetiae]|uniref:Uncharacterized protein n=1 Tax=Colletotrichum godetiae TaxID=1209918 RepID=A0AAJ0F4M4_9PEZI|nr:uncharacterized protein BDP55DRAFT_137682 [Colletotrichum godetiae]KAK1700605.1 hypothetical protein BDP55DRAFT_137682 [Colletotrichum godetiae]
MIANLYSRQSHLKLPWKYIHQTHKPCSNHSNPSTMRPKVAAATIFLRLWKACKLMMSTTTPATGVCPHVRSRRLRRARRFCAFVPVMVAGLLNPSLNLEGRSCDFNCPPLRPQNLSLKSGACARLPKSRLHNSDPRHLTNKIAAAAEIFAYAFPFDHHQKPAKADNFRGIRRASRETFQRIQHTSLILAAARRFNIEDVCRRRLILKNHSRLICNYISSGLRP